MVSKKQALLSGWQGMPSAGGLQNPAGETTVQETQLKHVLECRAHGDFRGPERKVEVGLIF